MPRKPARRRLSGRAVAWRALFVVVAGVSLYLLGPSLLEVFSSWDRLGRLAPEWIAVALAAEILSFVAVWQLQRVALQTRGWFAIATSQLAGNAFGRVIPGGLAAAGTLQYRMLVRAGIPGGRVASAVTAVSVLLFGTVLALPVLALPAIVAGTPAPGLVQAAYLGAAVLVLIAAGGAAVFVWNRPLALLGRAVERAANRTWQRSRPRHGLAERLLEERDALRRTFGARWRVAVTAAVGKWILDYAALLACLRAVGAEPSSALVLLAFVAASFLGMVPFTPGGIGFVEAGLTGMLALAGVGAGAALLATLAYRLVSFWLPIPSGGAAYLLFRRRYPG